MAKPFDLEISGFKKAERDFLKLHAGLRGKILADAALAMIIPIQARGQQLSPRLTGENARRIVAGVTRSTSLFAEAATGPNTPYGRRLEFGFFGTDRLGRKFRQRPQPYMRPAADQVQERSLEIGEQTIWLGAVKAAGGFRG